MFNIFRRGPSKTDEALAQAPSRPIEDGTSPDSKQPWFERLRAGLRKTGSALSQVFSGAKVDEALFEELESALLMADAGVQASAALLADLKRRVKASGANQPEQVKALLADALSELLAALERPFVLPDVKPAVIMVVGVNGAG